MLLIDRHVLMPASATETVKMKTELCQVEHGKEQTMINGNYNALIKKQLFELWTVSSGECLRNISKHNVEIVRHKYVQNTHLWSPVLACMKLRKYYAGM